MFGKKLVIIAAAVALAMGHVAAHEQAAHIKVSVSNAKKPHTQQHKKHQPHHAPVKHVKHVKKPIKHAKHAKQVSETSSDAGEFDPSEFCLEGWTPMSVEGVEGVFCVYGQACVDDIDGACPDPQQGLPYGGYCDTVETGVMGCKPVTEEMWWAANGEDDDGNTSGPVCGEGYSPMSVEGVEGVFCVEGQACVADIMGSCPGPQDDLEFGAYCGTVKTGVLGCKPYTEAQTPAEDDSDDSSEDDAAVCEEGSSPMSVEGVEGVFCVEGQACVADILGSCPDAQDGLEFGSYCGTVKTGVLGCKPYTDETQTPEEEGDVVVEVCEDGYSPMSVEGVEGIFCVEGQACVADIMGTCPEAQDGLEYGSYCGKVKTGVLGCKPYADDSHTPEEGESEGDEIEVEIDVCEEGSSPMSVEGVEGVFCVSGQACAGVEGSCPGPQDGLEYGSHCGTVASGVLGCKPNDAPPATEDCTGEGESPMSVEGVEGVFCVTGQACAGVDGACPGPQDGLEFGAYCGKVASGVLGCKPNTSKAMLKIHQATHVAKKHHAKAHSAKTAKASLRAHAKAPVKKQQPKKHAHPAVKKVVIHH